MMVRVVRIPVLGFRLDGVVEVLSMGREAARRTRRAGADRTILHSAGRTARGAIRARRAVFAPARGGRLPRVRGLGRQNLGAALGLGEGAGARAVASGRGRYALLGLLGLTAAGAAVAMRGIGRRESERASRPERIPEEAPGWSSDAARIWAEAERAGRDRIACELLGSVSHELYTPITRIQGFCSALRVVSDERFLPLGMEEGAWLAGIEENTDRLRELIDDMLDLVRLEAGIARMSFGWVRIDDVVEDLRPDLERIVEDRTLLIFGEQGGASPFIRCDVRWIGKLITKLVENAAKFSPPESTIAVRIERDEQGLRIGVLDQGVGIPAEQQDRVFHRFYQVQDTASGLPRGAGLGLAICRGIVEEHGGSIWVESRVGWGSTFYVALPLPEPESAR